MSNLTFQFTRQSGKRISTSLSRVHYITELTDQDRANLADKYPENDTTAYHTAIQYFDEDTQRLAAETIEDFRAAGVALCNIGQSRFTPAVNIGEAESFNKVDKDALVEKTGNEPNVTFRSRVTTPGQTHSFLTVRTPNQIIADRDRALGMTAAAAAPADPDDGPG